MSRQSYRKQFRCDALVICPNEAVKTYEFFKEYDLTYKTDEEILNNGANGVAVLVTFSRQGFTSTAVMKLPKITRNSSSIHEKKSKELDNLMREYLVGVGINDLCKTYPCFIRTYAAYTTGQTGTEVNTVRVNKLHHRPTTAESCKTAGHQSILIEYVKGETLKKKITDEEFQRTELVYVLFQLYYALAHVGARFTHYDLHLGNVLLYEPDKCVAFEYTLRGQVIRFQCRYVAKIIDYGRSYLQDVVAEVAKVETEPECLKSRCTNERPGDICGFKYFNKPGSIKFEKSNISQDLRCLQLCIKNTETWWTGPPVRFQNKFVTNEVTNSGLPHAIHHVGDALMVLERMVRDKEMCPIYGTVRVDGVNKWAFERVRHSVKKGSRINSTKKHPRSFLQQLFGS